eukprot:gene843-868_t
MGSTVNNDDKPAPKTSHLSIPNSHVASRRSVAISRCSHNRDHCDECVDVDTALEACNGFGRYQLETVAKFGNTWFWFGFFICFNIFADLPPDKVCVNMNGEEVCHAGMPTQEECDYGQSTSVEGNSMVAEFEMVCDRAKYVPIMNAGYFLGHMLFCMFTGPISDKYGRAPLIMWLHVIKHICAFSCALAPNALIYVITRFLIGCAAGALGLPAFCYQAEFLGSEWRAFLLVTSHVYFNLGVACLTGLAYFFPYWRVTIVIPAVAGFLLCPFLWRPPESPLWLASQNRLEEAHQTLCLVAKRNGKPEPPKIKRKENDNINGSVISAAGVEVVGNETIFSHPQWIFLLGSWVCWWGSVFSYYGIMMSAASWGDAYVSTFLGCFIDMPGFFAISWMYNNWGRRKPTFYCLIISSMFSLICIILPDGVLKATCATISKMFVSAIVCSLFVWAGEIFTTGCRVQGMSFCNTAGRIGGLLQGLFIGWSHNSMLFPVFAFAGYASAAASLLLPETVNRPLPSNLIELRLAQKQTGSIVSCVKRRPKTLSRNSRSYGSTA